MKHSISEEIAHYAYLENTRILAKGIEELYERYKHTSETWALASLKNFIKKSYQESIQPGTNQYLRQNPHVDFFSFRYPHASTSIVKEEDYYQMASMVQMYGQLKALEEHQHRVGHEGDLASDYELICNCLRELLEANLCYLTYRRLDDTQILAASSVRETELNHLFNSQDLGRLLDFLEAEQIKQQTTAIQKLPDEIRLVSVDAGADSASLPQQKVESLSGKYLIIPLGLYKQDFHLEEQVCLIFYFGDIYPFTTDTEWLSHIRDAMFLRGQLTKVLSHDLFQLLSARTEYRSIKKKTKSDEPLRILHLSDLHVTKENYEDIKRCIQNLSIKRSTFMEEDEVDEEDLVFDFMVITGDVAQGRCSAGELEDNYHYAADIIRTLAFKIWAQPRRKIEAGSSGEAGAFLELGQDWKKRLIIILGNHDYASMNELETQHDETHRASISGRPADREGSPMAKFTYYINFLRQLLDIDVGTLIDNGMNELRSYDALDISFLSLNSSIMANPIRNNKVHLDTDFVKRTTARFGAKDYERKHVVCLCHHGPQYDVDYISDQYYENFVCEEITKTFRDYFYSTILGKDTSPPVNKEAMDACWEEIRGASKHILEGNAPQNNEERNVLLQNESVQAWLRVNGETSIPDNIAERIKKGRQKSRLFADYQMLSAQEVFSGQHSSNERYQKIRSAIDRAGLLSNSDRALFSREFQALYDTHKLSVVLSGHTHKPSCTPEKSSYTADRFFTQSLQISKENTANTETIYALNFGICELSPFSGLERTSATEYKFKQARFRKEKDGHMRPEDVIDICPERDPKTTLNT